MSKAPPTPLKRLLPLFGGLIAVFFLIQSNVAWLNPRPGFEPEVKLSETVPFLWQYNIDATTEFFVASEFPHSMKETSIRVSRPGYPFVVKVVQETLEVFTALRVPESTVAAYLLLKFAVYLLYCALLWKLLTHFANEHVALLALVLSLFHPHAITYVATYQTTELQFITPVIVVYLLWDLSKSITLKKNVVYSLLVGFLMMAKPNYAVYMAALTFGLTQRRFAAVAVSAVSFLIPMAVWLVFLKLYGVPYHDNQAALYGQGVWLYEDFLLLPLKEQLLTVWTYVKYFTGMMVTFYGPWLFVGFAGLLYALRKNLLKSRSLLFFALLGVWTWGQYFAARHQADYMTSDFSFLIWGGAAYLIVEGIVKRTRLKPMMVTACLGALTLGIHVGRMMHWPWVPPQEQHGYSDVELSELEFYLAAHPGSTVEFWDDRLVNRVVGWNQPDPTPEDLEAFFVANAWATHDLTEAFESEAEGCQTYRFDTPYSIVQGSLILENPNDFQRIELSMNGVEWFSVPLAREVTLDYTMHRLGLQTMTLDPSRLSQTWGGYSYVISIDHPYAVGDFLTGDYAYDFVLYEDGVPLSQPHSSADSVIAEGLGRYMLSDNGMIIFSTSDNSNALTNGRTYEATYTAYAALAEPFGSKTYWLKFCPQTPGSDSFESEVQVKTLFQYNRALYPTLTVLYPDSSQVSFQHTTE